MNYAPIQQLANPHIECPVRNRLQALTGLRLDVININHEPRGQLEFIHHHAFEQLIEDCQRHFGVACFHSSEETLSFGVSLDEDQVILGQCDDTNLESSKYLQRLFRLAVDQIRNDEQQHQHEVDAELFTEHLSVLYEQVHAVTHLSRILSLAIPFDDIVPMFERVLTESMNVQSIFYFELAVDELQVQSSAIAQHASADILTALHHQLTLQTKDVAFVSDVGEEEILCTRISSKSPYPWLVAIPRPGSHLGSEEAQFLRTISRMLEAHLNNRALFVEKDLMQIAFVKSLISTLDARDHYTQGHSIRVAEVASQLAERMGLPEEEIDAIYTSGLLHDIGKIGISDEVLRKEDKLSESDWEEIKRHPVIGYEILSKVPQFASILPGVRHHHERIDGKGYPDGLRGIQIGMMPRILAVADSFDAMSSDRPYRKGMPSEKVDRIIAEGAGTQWDAAVVATFLQYRNEFRTRWAASFEKTYDNVTD